MGKKILNIKVNINGDYVYMSVEDWQKIVKILNHFSHNWSVEKEKNGDINILAMDNDILH